MKPYTSYPKHKRVRVDKKLFGFVVIPASHWCRCARSSIRHFGRRKGFCRRALLNQFISKRNLATVFGQLSHVSDGSVVRGIACRKQQTNTRATCFVLRWFRTWLRLAMYSGHIVLYTKLVDVELKSTKLRRSTASLSALHVEIDFVHAQVEHSHEHHR